MPKIFGHIYILVNLICLEIFYLGYDYNEFEPYLAP
jgi:hypothetical protein